MNSRVLVLIAILALALHGCGSGDTTVTGAKRPATAYGTGTIQGTISFVGTPPVMRILRNQPCCEDSTPIPEERVVVGPGGGLANTFVYLLDAPASDGSLPPTTLDQHNCRFVPHAIGVQVGQTLTLHSQDATMHTITYTPSNNTPRNFGLNFAGDEKTTTFDAAEFIHVRCDIHPWMSGWVGVFDHPFFAVTGDDGHFTISRVPAGHYKLASWHEQYGQQQQDIVVADGQTVSAHFDYRSP